MCGCTWVCVWTRVCGVCAVTFHDMGRNTFGFGRFLLARKLLNRHTPHFSQHVIMLDDDQYVQRDTLSTVYSSRQPRTYKTWYGKNWHPSETSYWKPTFGVAMRAAATATTTKFTHPEVKTWQYGGTGMSIVDAAIFFYPDIFKLDKEFQMIEDVWLSYIAQLAGWEISRLFITFKIDRTQSRSGQYIHLADLKNEMFRKVGYLRCSRTGEKDL